MRARCQATPDSDVRAWRCSLLSSGTYQGPLIELGLNLVIVSCTLKTVHLNRSGDPLVFSAALRPIAC